ncbi:DNA-binding HxlR family transcriptional regulator [Herbaspirillum sp. Sphag1AN]|uniref:winged helix-turn-helix transcriptional regulator n=1 Tax=unclassified Herbaspirillum TaxID=2624150 RepID=UPI00160A2F00|nr:MULTISPECIES: helix-turn-helix domain-containing protein [unclassified Herbaspirillum]MBB3211826.1 DNA-binding HxlR family transcriptional regulator [Herbaspirillum sp. Sphag1AN]MBB3244340.1 DNA-binding HxlR family transcriptional regulator [Herbaspirillum sp. Sphag64]
MQRKSFEDKQCPIARSLDRVGEWWSILILRDAFYGLSRFDEFQKHLEIAPNILTRRLSGLVEEGLLEKVQYSERPPRFEYHLTPRGRDFRPVLLALLNWGNKHFSPEGESVVLFNVETGERAEPIMVDANTGQPITPKSHVIGPGPAAGEKVKRSISELLERRAKQVVQS